MDKYKLTNYPYIFDITERALPPDRRCLKFHQIAISNLPLVVNIN